MSSSGANSRVSSIPENDLKTVRCIKEITKDHSDEDIYAMLKECAMDPAETIHRLSHLDTFHVVKSKRDKRKEKINNVLEEPKRRQGNQGRGSRNGQGSGSSQYSSQDVGGGRSSAARRENGPPQGREKGVKSPPLQLPKEADGTANNLAKISSSILVNGPAKMSNHFPGAGDGAKLFNVTDSSKDNLDVGVGKQNPSASNPILVPSRNSRLPTSVGAIKRDIHTRHVAPESSSVSSDQLHPGLDEPPKPDSEQNLISENSQPPPCPDNGTRLAGPTSNHGPEPGKIGQTEGSIASKAVAITVDGALSSVEPNGSVVEASAKLEKLKFSDGQHVIIPNHIQVPESVKNVLSFGSFGASSDVEVNYNNSEGISSDHTVDQFSPSKERPQCNVLENGPSSQDSPSNVQERNPSDLPQAPSVVPEQASVLERKVPSTTLLQDDQLKPGSLPAVGPPYPNLASGYSYYMPTMLGSPLVQLDALDAQARLSSSAGGNMQATSTTAPMPPPAQSGGVAPSSVSPQHLPLIRQPFPPNFYPYGQFFPPYFLPTHQFYGQSGFLPQMPASTMYMTPPTAAAGMKPPPASYKPGANSGNQAPPGMPFGVGIYASNQVGFNPNGAATSGNPTTNEDAPSLKENNIYARNQGEGSAWVPAGRDATTMPLNSFFNLPSQSGHGAYTVYPPLQPIAAPAAAGHPHMQQPQSMAGSVDSVGPPSNAYQQPQRQQMPWNNSNFS